MSRHGQSLQQRHLVSQMLLSTKSPCHSGFVGIQQASVSGALQLPKDMTVSQHHSPMLWAISVSTCIKDHQIKRCMAAHELTSSCAYCGEVNWSSNCWENRGWNTICSYRRYDDDDTPAEQWEFLFRSLVNISSQISSLTSFPEEGLVQWFDDDINKKFILVVSWTFLAAATLSWCSSWCHHPMATRQHILRSLIDTIQTRECVFVIIHYMRCLDLIIRCQSFVMVGRQISRKPHTQWFEFTIGTTEYMVYEISGGQPSRTIIGSV